MIVVFMSANSLRSKIFSTVQSPQVISLQTTTPLRTDQSVCVSVSGIRDMEDSQVTMGNITITNNTCTDQTGCGINIDYWAVSHMYGTTNAILGNVTVSGNTITVSDYLTYPSSDGISLMILITIITYMMRRQSATARSR